MKFQLFYYTEQNNQAKLIFFNERDLNELTQDASDHMEKPQLMNKINYNSKRKLSANYTDGDLILVNNYDVTAGVN